MGVFDRQIRSVERLVKKYGQLVTIMSSVPDTPDPNKPWEQVEDVPVSTDVYMVFLSPSVSGSALLGKEFIEYVKGSELKVSEVRGYMATTSVKPKVSDVVLRDGKELKIRALDILSPNGQDLLYTVEFES